MSVRRKNNCRTSLVHIEKVGEMTMTMILLRRMCLVILVFMVCLAMGTQIAMATEGGSSYYFPGASATFGVGVAPHPGFMMANQLIYYRGRSIISTKTMDFITIQYCRLPSMNWVISGQGWIVALIMYALALLSPISIPTPSHGMR